jgi:Arylsulfotransferase (ASST)
LNAPVRVASEPSAGLSRRGFVAVAGAGLGSLLVPGARAATVGVADDTGVRSFVSRPDLRPPTVDVATALPTAAPGYVFLAPFSGPSQFGPLIVDEAGEPVWFHPLPASSATVATDFRAQTYLGKPVLTWWEGTVMPNGYGQGEYVVADSSYAEIARFGAGNGYTADLHEFTITSSGTALIIASDAIPADFSAAGGPADGTLLDGIVQEIHIESGAVLFEWRSSEHVPLDESYFLPANGVWDYLHLNAVDERDDSSLLVSARHSCTVYKVDRDSGDIVWRLGGKHGDFGMGDGTQFWYQHDVRSHPDGTISVFDDGAFSLATPNEPVSRGLVLSLDETAMTASLDRGDANPGGALAFALGSVQLLEDAGLFVGWGTVPECSEFAADGTLRFDASLPGGGWSYRAYRLSWSGRPATPPALTVRRSQDGSADAYVSWNGATDVSHWQIAGGERRTELTPLRTVARAGFETPVRIKNAPAYLTASALDARGKTLATSRVIRA